MGLMSRIFGAASPLERIEPSFAAATRSGDMIDISGDMDLGWSTPSATGIRISQQTALQVAAVMACVSIVTEDVAKLTPRLYRRRADGGRTPLNDHPLAVLLRRPNDWQTWFEFILQMMPALMMRGNAYAVILRNKRGDPVMFVPINPDLCSLWQAPDGSLFFVVTRSGLHQLAVLRGVPLFVPYEDVLHWKGLSGDGLLGASKIALNRESIGLAAAMDQLAARAIGYGTHHSGTLNTDKKVSPDVAERLRSTWQEKKGGLLNAGKPLILEEGLKWTPMSLSLADMEFIASRNYQIQDIARLWRIPLHMLGDLTRATANNITQQSQEYLNYALMSYVTLIEQRFEFTFDLGADVFVEFDTSRILRADLAARYSAYRIGYQTSILTPNEMRAAEGMDPDPDPAAGKLFRAVNMVPIDADVGMGLDLPGLGSEMTGTGAPGGGRPPGDGSDPAPSD